MSVRNRRLSISNYIIVRVIGLIDDGKMGRPSISIIGCHIICNRGTFIIEY